MKRRTGETTRQMIRAPRGALFVWPHHGSLDYAEGLARHLDRADLKIVSPAWFLRPDKWSDRDIHAVVLDHATTLTALQFDGFVNVACRCRERSEERMGRNDEL